MFNLFSPQDMGCFSSDYHSARQKFTATYGQLAPDLVRSCQRFPHPLPGPQQETLYCDVVQLGQHDAPERLLVLISGTHGVEGFAGSAIQCDCLPLLEGLLRGHAELGVVIIHAFNPWGFAWLRRYDHEGIDLNRNFINFNADLPDNPGYEQLHPRLLSTLKSITELRALWKDMEFVSFINTITQGQYHHRDGLFYGGQAPSWSRTILEGITSAPQFSSASSIAVIDLHTGLGPYGYGEVINDYPVASAGYERAIKWYGENARSTELGESVSGFKQGLQDYHWFTVIGERGCFVTLEFGTSSLDGLLLNSINEQVYQNRVVQKGEQRDIHHNAVEQLKEFFYPCETSWQQQVLFRGRQIISMALDGILQ